MARTGWPAGWPFIFYFFSYTKRRRFALGKKLGLLKLLNNLTLLLTAASPIFLIQVKENANNAAALRFLCLCWLPHIVPIHSVSVLLFFILGSSGNFFSFHSKNYPFSQISISFDLEFWSKKLLNLDLFHKSVSPITYGTKPI